MSYSHVSVTQRATGEVIVMPRADFWTKLRAIPVAERQQLRPILQRGESWRGDEFIVKPLFGRNGE